MATDHKPSTGLWNDLVPLLWNLQGHKAKRAHQPWVWISKGLPEELEFKQKLRERGKGNQRT